MKHYLTSILALALLTSCATTEVTNIPGIRSTQIMDLTPYAERGFLITPERYDGEYDALGEIYIQHYPSARRQTPITTPGAQVHQDWVVIPVKGQVALDSLYAAGLRLGADAVMNFRISESPHPLRMLRFRDGELGGSELTETDLTGIVLRGFAIKRR